MSSHQDQPFLDVLQGRVPSRTPIWFMRQAGRCLPEYRKIRETMNTYDMFLSPDIATEITLQPLSRFDYDAAIVYADILHVADVLGSGLSFVRGEGPIMARSTRTRQDLERIKELWEGGQSEVLSGLSFIQKTLRGVLAKLPAGKALIGFAGSPWSVACYMIEGRSPGVTCSGVKKWMFEHSRLYHELMSILTEVTIEYLVMQHRAGAQALQIFESHSGLALSYDQYQNLCLPHVKNLLSALHERIPEVPLIYYMGGCGGKLPLLSSLKPYLRVLGVGHRISLGEVSTHPATSSLALQGNLDPEALHCDPGSLQQVVEEILDQGRKHAPGFIFNVGHGLRPDAPLHSIEAVIKQVHGAY